MLWLPKLFGKRCIATIHGIDWQRAKWGGFASKYIKFGEKVAAKYADEIIVLSEGVQKYFMDTYGRNTVFIPNGVNRPIPRSPQLIKEKYGLDKDEYTVIECTEIFVSLILISAAFRYILNTQSNIRSVYIYAASQGF